MSLTPAQFHSAIRLDACNHDPLCQGYRWNIPDEDVLATLVAWTLQGHYLHAERILSLQPGMPFASRQSVRQQVMTRLTLPPGTKNTPPRWHRDGLVFQHIAWLAAIIEGDRRVAASVPHSRPAHKGFDALLISLDDKNEAHAGIIICEEKATDNPRNQIQSEVWPSIVEVEAGERDAELTNELTAILRGYNVRNLEEVIADAHWLDHKAYRVSVTVGPQHDPDVQRQALFVGYDQTAPGHLTRRRAETLLVPHLRDWMDAFCVRVIKAL